MRNQKLLFCIAFSIINCIYCSSRTKVSSTEELLEKDLRNAEDTNLLAILRELQHMENLPFSWVILPLGLLDTLVNRSPWLIFARARNAIAQKKTLKERQQEIAKLEEQIKSTPASSEQATQTAFQPSPESIPTLEYIKLQVAIYILTNKLGVANFKTMQIVEGAVDIYDDTHVEDETATKITIEALLTKIQALLKESKYNEALQHIQTIKREILWQFATTPDLLNLKLAGDFRYKYIDLKTKLEEALAPRLSDAETTLTEVTDMEISTEKETLIKYTVDLLLYNKGLASVLSLMPELKDKVSRLTCLGAEEIKTQLTYLKLEVMGFYTPGITYGYYTWRLHNNTLSRVYSYSGYRYRIWFNFLPELANEIFSLEKNTSKTIKVYQYTVKKWILAWMENEAKLESRHLKAEEKENMANEMAEKSDVKFTLTKMTRSAATKFVNKTLGYQYGDNWIQITSEGIDAVIQEMKAKLKARDTVLSVYKKP